MFVLVVVLVVGTDTNLKGGVNNGNSCRNCHHFGLGLLVAPLLRLRVLA